ncbi:hypothetical protein BH23CHL5_BH23CHL5_02760 [soil metagenome]
MDDVAIVEESIELLPQIGKLVYSAVVDDPAMRSLTMVQAKAIGHLYHHGEQTVTEMAAGLGVSMPSASELIDRLLDKGLVGRTVDPDDRRRQIVALTPASLQFAKRIHDLRRTQVRSALAQLPPEEWPVFVKSLRALASTIGTTADGIEHHEAIARE